MARRIPTELSALFDAARILERPDGIYWQSKETEHTFGPFASMEEALADLAYNEDSLYEPGESLEEAEAELGLSEWIDPDTGVPAEEFVPRLEDH